MQLHCLRALALGVAVTAVTSVRSQDGLAQLVPGDAKFACYIDLQAAIDFIGRDLLQAAIAKQAGAHGDVRLRRDWNERMAKEWGIDPLRDLHGLLLFGNELQREEPQVVVLASDGVDRLFAKLHEMGALERGERDGVEFDRIAPDKVLSAFGIEEHAMDGEGYIHVRNLRGQGSQRAITFGTSLDKLVPRAGALGGRAGREHALSLRPRKGCIAYLEVADALSQMLGETPASRMANKTKHFAMQLSDADGEIAFSAALEAGNDKDARQIAALVNGLKALMSLVEIGDEVPEEVIEALSNAHADADGNRVTLEVKVGRGILDQTRKAIRDQLQGDEEDEHQPAPKPKPGARTKRSIR